MINDKPRQVQTIPDKAEQDNITKEYHVGKTNHRDITETAKHLRRQYYWAAMPKTVFVKEVIWRIAVWAKRKSRFEASKREERRGLVVISVLEWTRVIQSSLSFGLTLDTSVSERPERPHLSKDAQIGLNLMAPFPALCLLWEKILPTDLLNLPNAKQGPTKDFSRGHFVPMELIRMSLNCEIVLIVEIEERNSGPVGWEDEMVNAEISQQKEAQPLFLGQSCAAELSANNRDGCDGGTTCWNASAQHGSGVDARGGSKAASEQSANQRPEKEMLRWPESLRCLGTL
ncbi:hypothetical protein AAG570_006251 [Ranatra chinensis]|uniref:Uncharacterized protein n=1 Tax=Ranatra chinensis TaxID=642074 RepID=A0ABD0YTF8_9HEMI